jgi:hypothetical protein
VYTIGDTKERFIPMTKKPVGRIIFLGGSYTFGHGVDDDKTYTYLLGKRYWENWHIVNKAVMGWGTSHAYLLVSEEIEGSTPPSVVIYAMIPDHIPRNYIRRDWVKYLKRDHPHFELINGKLELQGTITVAGSELDSPEVREKELDLTKAFLVEMSKKCGNKNIPFIVVLLPSREWPPVIPIITTILVEHNIPYLDISRMNIKGFPNDYHPNQNDHELIAGAISGSFITAKLAELEKSLLL